GGRHGGGGRRGRGGGRGHRRGGRRDRGGRRGHGGGGRRGRRGGRRVGGGGGGATAASVGAAAALDAVADGVAGDLAAAVGGEGRGLRALRDRDTEVVALALDGRIDVLHGDAVDLRAGRVEHLDDDGVGSAADGHLELAVGLLAVARRVEGRRGDAGGDDRALGPDDVARGVGLVGGAGGAGEADREG